MVQVAVVDMADLVFIGWMTPVDTSAYPRVTAESGPLACPVRRRVLHAGAALVSQWASCGRVRNRVRWLHFRLSSRGAAESTGSALQEREWAAY